MGIALRFSGFKVRRAWLLAAISVLLIGMKSLCKLHGFESLGAEMNVVAVPFSFALLWLLGSVRLPKYVTMNSFPIFLMHSTMLKISLVVIVAVGIRRQMDTSTSLALVRVLFAVSASIIVSQNIRKFAPRAAAYIFGGR